MALIRRKIIRLLGTTTDKPSIGTTHEEYWDTDTNHLFRGTGSGWVDLGYGGGGGEWPGFYESNPAALGTATPGNATTAAHGNHVHPMPSAADVGASPSSHASLTTTAHGGLVASTDARLTDARTPTTHSHAAADVTGTAVVTNDARLSDARAPTSHNNTAHSETYITSAAITSHEGLADPHTGYQKESEKGAVSGYCGLDSAQKVPTANLGGAGADNTKYLRGDQTWQTVTASGVPVGTDPYVYPISFAPNAAFTTYLSLAANGGTLAVPFQVNAPTLLVSVSVRNGDTATARSWRWNLYKDAGANSLNTVAGAAASEAFTPSAVSTRTLDASTPTLLSPGTYWLAIQNTHATSTFNMGSTAASSAFNRSTAQTKTTANPNTNPLDFVAATWTKVTAMYAARLNCAVFGQSTAF